MVLFFTKIHSISPNELQAVLANPPKGAAFIDVRTSSEWNAGHIAGFRHIPLDELPNHLGELANASAIYLLCRSGGRSAQACKILENAGHTGAINIAGGITALLHAGFCLIR